MASAIWAGSIFLSRLMGLVREQIIGRTLGASREADLYFASFTLPDFLNYLLAAGALSIVFIPIFLEHLEHGDEEGGWLAFSVVANFILVVGSIAIALLMVFARPLVGLVAPGFTNPGEVDTLVRLIRIILPAQFFLVVGGLLSAALQAQDLHFLPAMAPLVYSAGIIAGGMVGAHYAGMGADGFAVGATVAREKRAAGKLSRSDCYCFFHVKVLTALFDGAVRHAPRRHAAGEDLRVSFPFGPYQRKCDFAQSRIWHLPSNGGKDAVELFRARIVNALRCRFESHQDSLVATFSRAW
jgi:hypothetical protein